MIKKLLVIIVLAVASLIFTSQCRAAEIMFFDSTNNYLGACQLTNKSEWEIKEAVKVTKFEVWYSWDQGEANLPVKLFLNGELFAEFEASRSACDPYQKQWCNADYSINKLFPAGKYTTEIPSSRQCLKPGGTGAIRLYKEDSLTPTEKPSPTIVDNKEEAVGPIPTVILPATACACNQTTIIVSAVAASLISSTIFLLLLKRR